MIEILVALIMSWIGQIKRLVMPGSKEEEISRPRSCEEETRDLMELLVWLNLFK